MSQQLRISVRAKVGTDTQRGYACKANALERRYSSILKAQGDVRCCYLIFVVSDRLETIDQKLTLTPLVTAP